MSSPHAHLHYYLPPSLLLLSSAYPSSSLRLRTSHLLWNLLWIKWNYSHQLYRLLIPLFLSNDCHWSIHHQRFYYNLLSTGYSLLSTIHRFSGSSLHHNGSYQKTLFPEKIFSFTQAFSQSKEKVGWFEKVGRRGEKKRKRWKGFRRKSSWRSG